ncbi:MAG: radical SAM protein [Pirellulales bacterium]|nr:radical SAM protein [Pirellulales bacterium]
MVDGYGRVLDYLRISVTDRCNLRCRYCMTEEGVPPLPHEAILSYEEIAQVARAAARRGVKKLRITGGEPLVRREIETLVRMLAAIEGIIDLAMTTNGILLERLASALAAAGLRRVNVSVDTVDPRRFAEITRGGDIRKLFAGIDAARSAGLHPVKLNCVATEYSTPSDLAGVKAYAASEKLDVRFIRQMHLPSGAFSAVEGGGGGDCPRCNRLRLSSDGLLRPCLFSDLGFSVRELGAEEALRRATAGKPRAGTRCTSHPMHRIGG